MAYILNGKLEGIDPRGKLKGLRECECLTAYQKLYKSIATGKRAFPIFLIKLWAKMVL